MMQRDRGTTRTSDEPMGTADIVQKAEESKAEERKYAEGRTEDKSTSVRLEEQDGHLTSLLPENETRDLHSRWTSIQTEFVDEPRGTLEKADGLVAEVMTRLAEVFAEQRSGLEKQWDRGEQTSTEDLRVALQRYRSFFQRLLSF